MKKKDIEQALGANGVWGKGPKGGQFHLVKNTEPGKIVAVCGRELAWSFPVERPSDSEICQSCLKQA